MDKPSRLKDKDADAGYEYFLSRYHDLNDTFIPNKKNRTCLKNNAPWLKPDVCSCPD